MATMNVSLPDPMRDWVQSRIDSGRYASVSDYVRDLIRKDQETTAARELSVAQIRQSIEDSRRDGALVPADEVFAALDAKLKAMGG
ncbi:type II toxin-antitoxin system ParD family antitoxin [Methyloraptor flagellatus]|uniref:Type II toxin-antitoxin system ParD family antitoxin n=1 Tax=Methyloraptor flagellatus TaxID=3162530 RepID=A0AAU7XEG7_9HYPH